MAEKTVVKINELYYNINSIVCDHCGVRFMDKNQQDSHYMGSSISGDGWVCDSQSCHFEELRNYQDNVITEDDLVIINDDNEEVLDYA